MGAFLILSASAAGILLVSAQFNPFEGLCGDIIGGAEVEPHPRPFIALISRENRKSICGGSLIKENWVLTAAHCNVNKSKVILGVHSQKEREREKQVFQIAKQIHYPCYCSSCKENDIMLLQLQKRAKLNKAVQLILLPTSEDNPKTGTIYAVAGWVQTHNHLKKSSDTLMEVNVTVISRKICNDNNNYKKNPFVTDNMICAGNKNGGEDLCSGDSGGPLRCKNVMRGITAFGKVKCGSVDGPGVYYCLTKK